MHIELYSKQVKQIASKILDETNVVQNLNEFGEVIICGSYKYDLMWGHDIDIIVRCDDARKASKNALQKLIELRSFQKYEYGDFVKYRRNNRPESYIINLRLPYNGQNWEIETWFFEELPLEQIEIDNLIREKLNDKNKRTILEMKKLRDERGKSKNQINSTEIYKRVLKDGIKNFDELECDVDKR